MPGARREMQAHLRFVRGYLAEHEIPDRALPYFQASGGSEN